MFMILIGLGSAFMLLGLVIATDWIDHKLPITIPLPRGQPPKTATPKPDLRAEQIPPFLTSPDQCVGCGRDDELLNLENRCIYCHEDHYMKGN